MQLDSLFDPRKRFVVEDDVREELKQPAKNLNDEYASAMIRIDESSRTLRNIARKMLFWLLCSQRLLSAAETNAAVAVDLRGADVPLDSTELVGMPHARHI